MYKKSVDCLTKHKTESPQFKTFIEVRTMDRGVVSGKGEVGVGVRTIEGVVSGRWGEVREEVGLGTIA